MTTTAPPDLLALRTRLMAETGLSSPVEVGIVGDAAHAARGGYHISADDIFKAGKWGDFSTSDVRDRHRPDPFASALDLGDNWPRTHLGKSGRATWIDFNNNLVWEFAHHPDRFPGLRAVNYTPDGTTKLRLDSAHPDRGPIASSDTVDIHTHLEWWRNSRDHRQPCLDRIVEHVLIAQGRPIAAAAPPPVPQFEEADMIYTVSGVPAGTVDFAGNPVPESGQCVATPAGPFGLTGSEFFSLPASAQAVRIKIPWSRLLTLCQGLARINQQPVDVDVQAIAHAVAVELANDPNNPLTQDDIPAFAETVVGAFAKHLSRTPNP